MPIATDPRIAEFVLEFERCGLPVKTDTIAYENDLQGYAAVVGPNASNTAIDCYAASRLALAIDLDFQTQDEADRFSAALARRPDMMVLAASHEESQRQWLSDRGLLAGLPKYDPSEPLTQFAEAIERHYDAKPGSLIEVCGQDTIWIRPGIDFPAISYLMSVYEVSGLYGSGVRLMLLGEDGGD